MRGSESLWRSAEHLFELTTEVRLAGEFKFGRRRLVGVTLRDELLCHATLKIAEPAAWSAMEVLTEEPLQLSLGDGTKRSHLSGAKIGLPRHLFPLFYC
jgi:hypothetical protein